MKLLLRAQTWDIIPVVAAILSRIEALIAQSVPRISKEASNEDLLLLRQLITLEGGIRTNAVWC